MARQFSVAFSGVLDAASLNGWKNVLTNLVPILPTTTITVSYETDPNLPENVDLNALFDFVQGRVSANAEVGLRVVDRR